MKYIQIMKLPDRKKKAICVIDTEKDNCSYVIGYINHNESIFVQALVDSKYFQYVNDEAEEKGE